MIPIFYLILDIPILISSGLPKYIHEVTSLSTFVAEYSATIAAFIMPAAAIVIVGLMERAALTKSVRSLILNHPH